MGRVSGGSIGLETAAVNSLEVNVPSKTLHVRDVIGEALEG